LKEAYTVEAVADRICEALSLGLANGVVACRMFVDVDSFAGLTELEERSRPGAGWVG